MSPSALLSLVPLNICDIWPFDAITTLFGFVFSNIWTFLGYFIVVWCQQCNFCGLSHHDNLVLVVVTFSIAMSFHWLPFCKVGVTVSIIILAICVIGIECFTWTSSSLDSYELLSLQCLHLLIFFFSVSSFLISFIIHYKDASSVISSFLLTPLIVQWSYIFIFIHCSRDLCETFEFIIQHCLHRSSSSHCSCLLHHI